MNVLLKMLEPGSQGEKIKSQERVQINVPDEGPRDHHREEMERREKARREETPARGITIIDFTI